MAIFHFSVKAISRADGKSAVACAAYRAGEKLTCEYYGKVQDYTRKTGVEHSQIYAPNNTKEKLLDRQNLWNAVEKAERKKNALLAREFEIAFPSELNAQQRKKMLDELCQKLVKKHGVIVDAAIHAPHTDGGSDERNYHAHIMFTTRAIDPKNGEFSAKKYRDFSRDSGTKTVCHWREYFADLTNDHLAKAGFAVRVDHRSYKDQKNGLEATTHEGPKATKLRRLGVTTEIILKNDAIKQRNAECIEAPRILKHLEQEIFASEKIVSTLKSEREELNVKINKNNLVEAHERVQNFREIYEAFHNSINNRAPTPEKLKIVIEHDFQHKSEQYLKDLEFLKEHDITPKPKGLFGRFFTPLIETKDVLKDLVVIKNLKKEEAERKAKLENERTAQAQARREDAERSKKAQSEINEFQNRVKQLAKNAGYPNDFFSEKFKLNSFYTNTYDIFSELGAVQKGDHQSYLNLVGARYEKIQKEFTEEFAHTHHGRCPGKESFQDLYALIQADKKVAQSFDIKAFEHINKIEKAVKNYENSLYNRELSSSPKVNLEHTPTAEKKLNIENQFKP